MSSDKKAELLTQSSEKKKSPPLPLQESSLITTEHNEVTELIQEEPLLFIDVNLGANHTERITVNQGDDLKETADKFARLYGLDADSEARLLILIQ